MKVIEKFKHIELIEIASEELYCVRRTYKNWLRQTKQDFYVLDRRGTDFTYQDLYAPVTVGTYDRCLYVFRANAIKAGVI